MIKPYLPIAAGLLVVINGLLLFPGIRTYTIPIALLGLLLAFVVLALSFLGKQEAGVTRAPAPALVVQPPAPVANQAETEIVAFLALLQEKGRLVDFLVDDIAPYDDAQVGAAARVIHQGCAEVLREHFKITAVSEVEEGSQVTVPAGYAASDYRFIGKLGGNPPFSGKLIHKGWKTEYVKLPRTTKTDRLPAIAPAEVELD